MRPIDSSSSSTLATNDFTVTGERRESVRCRIPGHLPDTGRRKPQLGYYGAREVDESMALMTVFHGGPKAIREPRIIVGRYSKDFGPGFYCTVIREQAERWARRLPTPVVNEYEVRMAAGLRVLEFKEMTDGWLDFIATCRNGVSHDHDIVIGPMANDQVWNYVADYLDGTITRDQFWVLARFKYPTHQIAFCSEASLACLTFVSAREVSL